jgi:autotransporter-associated beta strand protein
LTLGASLIVGVHALASATGSVLGTVGTLGVAFNYQIALTSNPTGFAATGLPPGLSLDSATGLISGTATVAGTTFATISETNAGGTASSQLVVMTPPLPGAPGPGNNPPQILSETGTSQTVQPGLDNTLLINPGKGFMEYWGPTTKYTTEVAGVGYDRCSWSQMEPSEGVYNWGWIDYKVAEYAAYGKKFAFGIIATDPDFNNPGNINPATPAWVFAPGTNASSGTVYPVGAASKWITDGYNVPVVWDEPVYLARMKEFIKAMGEHVATLIAQNNGNNPIAFIDVRNYGRDGEGNGAWLPGLVDVSPESLRDNFFKPYLDAFPDTQLFLLGKDDVYHDVFVYEVSQGMGARNDGIGGDAGYRTNWGCKTLAYPNQPTALEFAIGWPEMVAAGNGDPNMLMRFVAGERPSYLQLYTDYYEAYPEFFKSLGNLLGYHFVINQAVIPKIITANVAFPLSIEWYNDGIAPNYEPCSVAVALLDTGNNVVQKQWLATSNPAGWMPGEAATENYNVTFTTVPSGYKLAVGLFARQSDADPAYKLGIQGKVNGGWYILSGSTNWAAAQWTNPFGGGWNGANWSGNNRHTGIDVIADFSTLNLTADATVTLDGNVTLGNLIFGDTTPSHNWALNTGTGAGVLTLQTSSGKPAPCFTVNNQTATLNADLTGNQGFTKSGAGRLVLAGTNNQVGNTVINAGVLEIASKLYSNWAAARSSVTVNTGGTLRVNGWGGYDNWGDVANVLMGDPNNLLLNGGTLEFSGVNAASGNRTFSLGANGGTLKNSSAQTWDLGAWAGNPDEGHVWAILTNNSGLTLAGTGPAGFLDKNIVGTGSLTKTDAGTWTLTGTNTYSGATTVSAGNLTVSGTITTTAAATIASGAQMNVTGRLYAAGNITNNGTLVLSGSGQLGAGGTITNNGTIINNSPTLTLPAIVGNGTITNVLPAPWVNADIGSVGTTGGVAYLAGAFTVKGGGRGIRSSADTLNYTYQNTTGDCSVIARVASIQNTNSSAKAGVTIRESIAAGSAEAGIWVTPSSGIIFTYRTVGTTGGTTTASSSGKTAPYWVKLTRVGNLISAYYSTNGTSWTQLGTTQTFTMAPNVTIGVGVTSGVSGTLCTAKLDNVSTPGWSIPPDGLAATAVSQMHINLTWNPVSGATGYQVLRSATWNGTFSQIGSPATTSYSDTGLAPDTDYYYLVRATNSTSGTSGNSAVEMGTTLAAVPTVVSATGSNAAVTLSWSASTGVTGYNIKRSTVDGSGYVTIASNIATTRYIDTGVTNWTIYYYVVSVVDSGVEGANSAQAAAQPMDAQAQAWTPLNLSNSQLKNWYDASDSSTLWRDVAATSPVTVGGQTVLRWNDKSVNGNHLTTSSGGPVYADGVMNSLPVVRFNGDMMANLTASMGSASDNFTVIGVFKVARNLAYDNWVDWGPDSGYSGQVFVASGTRPGGPAQSMEFAYGGGVGENTDGAVTGQSAFLFAGAANQAVSPTLDSVWMNGISQGARNPDTYTAQTGAVTHINLGSIHQELHGDIAELIVVNTGTGTLAERDRQMIEGYLANKWWGTGSNNPLSSAHPFKYSLPMIELQPPSAPAGVTATGGHAQVALSWSASAGATGYNVKRSTVNGSGYTTIVSNAASTSYTDTGVTNGTIYYYVVSALNSGGEGANSVQAAAQPAGTQAQAWTPLMLASSQLKNWYDAADLTTLWQNTGGTTAVTDDGQTVLRVNDKSVNGNHLATNSGGPSYTTGVMNSLPVLRFNGGTLANLAPSMGAITDNFTVIGVFKVVSNNGWDNWVSWGNGNVGGGDPVVFVASAARTGGPSEGMELAYNGGEGETTDTAVTGQPAFLFASAMNQAVSPSLFSVWMNGASQGERNTTLVYTTTPSSSLTQFRIGQANNQQPHGDIAELIVVNTGTGTLAESDRQMIEGYLANKWWGSGSNNMLPAGHPFKTSAPKSNLSPPAATAGLTATAGTSQVALSWSAAAGAAGYNVKRSTVSGSGYVTIANNISATSYIDTGVTNWTTYYYVVCASNAGGEGADSAQAAAQPVASQSLPWTPTQLTSGQLKNWYDAADATTLWQNAGGTTAITASGQTVLRWNDKSSNRNHLTTNSGSPAYTTGVMNSLPVVRFNGDMMANVAASMGNASDNFTVIGVFKVANNSSWDNWVDWGPATGYSGLVFVASGARPGGPAQSMEVSYGGGIGENTDVAVTGQPAFLFAGAANQSVSPTLDSVWMNGVSQGARNPDTYTALSGPVTHINLGIYGQVPRGDIAELIVVNTGAGTLADSDRQMIEGYLANKWWGAGANNLLPADHPFKASAPAYQNQIWAANVNFNWNTTTANWSGAVWNNGSNAVFGSTGVGTVNLGAGLTANSLTFNTAGYTLSGGSLGLTGAATITANVGATISAALTGSQGLAFSGAGTLVLTGSNTYTGTTSINDGTLWFGVNHNSLGAVVLANAAGARLSLNYNNSLSGLSIGSLAGGGANGGNVDLRGDTLTVGGDNTSTIYAGQITSSGGGGNLVKSGAGTLTLAGSNTYGGTTHVNQGTLIMGGSAGTASLTVASGAGLGNLGQLSLSGTLSLAGGSYLNLNLDVAGGPEAIRLTGGYSAPGSPVKININALAGFGSGTYTLITGAGGISASSFVLNSVPPGYTLALSASNGTLSLACTQYAPVRILPLGDSITFGYGGDPNKGGYRTPLYNLLTAAGYNVNFIGTSTDNSGEMAQPHHEGHPGYQISGIGTYLVPWLDAVEYPDVILLHIGTNDFGVFNNTAAAIDRLDQLIGWIADLRPRAHIIVTNLLEREEPYNTTIQAQFNPYVQAKVDAQAALGRRVTFLDMRSAVPVSNMPDSLHPNQTGYNLMAAAWLPAIQAVWAPQGDLTPPAVSTGLAATAGNGQVALSWSATAGATGYNVKRSTVNGSDYVTIANNIAAASFTDTGVSNWTTYYYVVAAVNPGGEGPNSAQVVATPQSPAISPAEQYVSTGLSVTGGTATVTFSSSVVGHTYQLQSSDFLTAGTWVNCGAALPGTGGDLVFAAPYDNTQPRKFYRIQIRQ